MERQGTFCLLSNFIHFYGKDTVSTPYIISTVALETVAYVFGGVCLNFIEIKDFCQPIRLRGQAFRGYEIEVKTPIYKKFKSGPERLKGRE